MIIDHMTDCSTIVLCSVKNLHFYAKPVSEIHILLNLDIYMNTGCFYNYSIAIEYVTTSIYVLCQRDMMKYSRTLFSPSDSSLILWFIIPREIPPNYRVNVHFHS